MIIEPGVTIGGAKIRATVQLQHITLVQAT